MASRLAHENIDFSRIISIAVATNSSILAMAIEYNFGGIVAIEPDVYGERASGLPTTPEAVTFGNVLIIDTGLSPNFGVGAGVNGESAKGKRAIRRFDSSATFANRIRGGEFYDIAEVLFNPLNDNATNGIDSLSYISASKTRSARIGLAFSNGSGGGAKGVCNLKAVTVTIPTLGGGTGYAVSDTITLSGGTFTVATVLTVATIGVGGTVTSVTITTAGAYTKAILGTATQASTSGAGVGFTATVSFGLNAVTITEGGSGYTTAPQVRIFGDGVGGVVTSTLTADEVTSGTATTAGTGYTESATLFFVATDGDGGEIILRTLVEGYSANGVETSGKITQGFGVKMFAGKIDTTKFYLAFYKGTFTGLDADGEPYNYVAEADSEPVIIAKSDEFGNVQELLNWMASNTAFQAWFVKESSAIYGTGEVSTDDLINNANNNLAVSGNQYYTASYVDDVLNALEDYDFDFVLCDKFGGTSNGAQSISNVKIVEFVRSLKKQLPQVYIACGKDETEFDTTYGSIGSARFFNDEAVSLVHSEVFIQGRGGLKRKSQFYHSALILGREAGLPTQTPVTQKTINVKGVMHELNTPEREKALQGGILHTKQDGSLWVVNQGVNTYVDGKNKELILPDGTSYEKSMRRIDGQLFKEIRSQAKKKGFAGGGNRFTASVLEVEIFIIAYLQSRCVTDTQDNILLEFERVVVTQEKDANFMSFYVKKNSPINKLFFRSFSIF